MPDETLPRLPALARLPGARDALLVAWRRGLVTPPRGLHRGEVDGLTLVGDAADHTHRKMLAGSYEPSLRRLVHEVLRPGDAVVDVGAHIGWFTLLAAASVGPTGAVRSFEPFPSSFALLERNVRDDGLAQVQVQQVAVGAEAGSLRLGPQAGSDSGSVSAAAGAGEGGLEVPVATLDDLLAEGTTHAGIAAPLRLLKLDVEGYEPEVLAGAPATLARCEVLLYEVNRPALAALGHDEGALRQAVADAGFRHQQDVPEVGLRRLKGEAQVLNVVARR